MLRLQLAIQNSTVIHDDNELAALSLKHGFDLCALREERHVLRRCRSTPEQLILYKLEDGEESWWWVHAPLANKMLCGFYRID